MSKKEFTIPTKIKVGFIKGCNKFMLKEAIATAKTIEEAVTKACAELGVNQEDATIEVLEQPKTGFFRRTPAKVRVYIENTKVDLAEKTLRDLLLRMDVDWEIDLTIVEEENSARITMDGDKLGFIIGYRGETLDALQYIVGLMTNQIDGEYYRITLDCGNYRSKREATLEKLAGRLSKKVARSGYSSKLEPMNPYERRIIHSVVQNQKDVTSESIGEEPYRAVVIKSTNPEAARKNAKRKFDGPPRGRTPAKGRPQSSSRRQSATRPPTKRPERKPPIKTEDIKPANTKPTTTSEKVIGDLYGKIEL